jgi:hypothetical protein
VTLTIPTEKSVPCRCGHPEEDHVEGICDGCLDEDEPVMDPRHEYQRREGMH